MKADEPAGISVAAQPAGQAPAAAALSVSANATGLAPELLPPLGRT